MKRGRARIGIVSSVFYPEGIVLKSDMWRNRSADETWKIMITVSEYSEKPKQSIYVQEPCCRSGMPRSVKSST